ncbi:MAG: polysaccharide deacetylase family protein [Ruminococcus sp.]|nr:polysaccharide deacetylase family protein [Ruminococcus sp.]
MKRIIALVLSVLLSVMFIAGCANDASTNQTETTVDEIQTSTGCNTQPTTTVPVTTTAPATEATEDTTAKEIIYNAITSNKVSSDLWYDPTEPTEAPVVVPVVKPSKPANPDATGDEAATTPEIQRPTYTTDDKNYKYIAFTFDDGPHYELTYMFADKLREYGGVGTFYVVGNRIHGEQAEAMKYAYDLGNEIGIHGYTHEYYYHTCSDATFRSELSKTAKLITDITGEAPLTMRPVGGGITSSRVKSSGYVVINWNVDSNDWRYTSRYSSYVKKQNVNAIVENVLNSTDEGDIILFHEIYYNSYDAFCKVIDDLYKRGYRFVTVSQLLALDDSDRGKLYYNAY